MRADPQRLGKLWHIGDGAAAGAHRFHVQRGGADGEVADFGGAHAPRFEIFDERHIGGGAADIQREDIVQPRILGDPQRAGDAAGRAGHEERDRLFF